MFLTSIRQFAFGIILLQLINITNGQQVGVDICACSPRVYEMTLDFSLTCPPILVEIGEGVIEGSCLITSFDNPEVIDLIPVAVSSVQFIELGQDGTPLSVTQETGDFRNRSVLTYRSVSEKGIIPLAFQTRAIGMNEDGDTLIMQWALTYNNDCGIFPILDEGESVGWTVFTDLTNPLQTVCPIGEIPTVLTTEPPILQPTLELTEEPTEETTIELSELRTENPTMKPTEAPTETPTMKLTEVPTKMATMEPTKLPTENSTMELTKMPTENPTAEPIEMPIVSTKVPTENPSVKPTVMQSGVPTIEHSATPTESTADPTNMPTDMRIDLITDMPIDLIIGEPIDIITDMPTDKPTDMPTNMPTENLTDMPTEKLTDMSTENLTAIPTTNPSASTIPPFPTERPSIPKRSSRSRLQQLEKETEDSKNSSKDTWNNYQGDDDNLEASDENLFENDENEREDDVFTGSSGNSEDHFFLEKMEEEQEMEKEQEMEEEQDLRSHDGRDTDSTHVSMDIGREGSADSNGDDDDLLKRGDNLLATDDPMTENGHFSQVVENFEEQFVAMEEELNEELLNDYFVHEGGRSKDGSKIKGESRSRYRSTGKVMDGARGSMDSIEHREDALAMEENFAKDMLAMEEDLSKLNDYYSRNGGKGGKKKGKKTSRNKSATKMKKKEHNNKKKESKVNKYVGSIDDEDYYYSGNSKAGKKSKKMMRRFVRARN